MDSTLALGAFRIGRDAGGEAVREREPRIPKPPGCSQGAQRAVFCAVRVGDFLAEGAGVGSLPRSWRRVWLPPAASALKKFVISLPDSLPSSFGLPTSQGRGGLGCMDSTLALGAFRIARDAGGEAVREREPRRAGEGRLVWNRNCFLMDYGLWAAKSEGRPWVEHCIEQCIE